jgi:hypothetical protein
MSAESDKFEKLIAESINKIPGIKAERPKVSVEYADVRIKKSNITTWCEVKMNHTDNLSNPRVYYMGGKWQTTYKTPAAAEAVKLLNIDPMTKKFLKDISKFSGIPFAKLIIPTSKTQLKLPGAVPLLVMKAYFEQPNVNRYIAEKNNFDIGALVTKHYTIGKAEPAYYMQAGDDFYLISDKNPLKLSKKIPLLSGKGDFKVRISTRSEFMEVQAEIKIKKMPDSPYSCNPKSKKKNPFVV